MNNTLEREYTLLSAFGFIDEKYIEEASPENDTNPQAAWFAVGTVPVIKKVKPKLTWLQYAAAAAAVFVAITAAVILFPKTGTDEPGDHHGVTQTLSFTLHDSPSGKFQTLPELAAYLKLYGDPDGRTAAAYDGKIISSVDMASPVFQMPDIVTGSDSVRDKTGEYLYRIENGSVTISSPEGIVGNIDIPADSVFVKGDSLIVISHNKNISSDVSTNINIYDISDPGNPSLRDEYKQLGENAACWLKGDELYIITNGMGKLSSDAVPDYYPSLTHNGESVTWDDGDVSILGEPVTLQYSALTVINALSSVIQHKEALYGNIQRLFCGEDWFAAAAAAETSAFRENPVLYTFNTLMDFTGSISLAEITGAPAKNTLIGGAEQNGEYLSIISVEKYGDLFRMLGTKTVREDGGDIAASGNDEFFMAVAADITTGKAGLKLIPADDYPDGLNTQILWLDDKVTMYMNGEDDYIDIPFYDFDIGDSAQETFAGGVDTTQTTAETTSDAESTSVSILPGEDNGTTTAKTTATTTAGGGDSAMINLPGGTGGDPQNTHEWTISTTGTTTTTAEVDVTSTTTTAVTTARTTTTPKPTTTTTTTTTRTSSTTKSATITTKPTITTTATSAMTTTPKPDGGDFGTEDDM